MRRFLALLPLLALAAAPGRVEAVQAATTTFQFAGQCGNCFKGNRTAYGYLVLHNYTLGDTFGAAEFVSFTYESADLTTGFTVAAGDPDLYVVSGKLDTIPGEDNVSILTANTSFNSVGPTGFPFAGFWCVGQGCVAGEGRTHSWSVVATPEPASLALLAGPLLALGAARRRR